MATALVLGVNGQDGSYLAETLLDRGNTVIGVGRQRASRWVDMHRFRYVALEIGDRAALDDLLATLRPQEIYHLAAVHGSAGHEYEAIWRDALEVNVAALHQCLEHMRVRTPQARLFYPSSLKAFGANPPPCIDEDTPRVSSCLYGITKNAAHDLIRYYRAQHGVWASVGFFFNHDSPRRPDTYFLPRLVTWLAAQQRGAKAPPPATLDFWCDWGSSQEYMTLVADLMQAPVPTDLVFATGRPVHAAALATRLARALELDVPAEPAAGEPPFRAELSRMRNVLGRTPQCGAFDVAAWIFREQFGIVLGPGGETTA